MSNAQMKTITSLPVEMIEMALNSEFNVPTNALREMAHDIKTQMPEDEMSDLAAMVMATLQVGCMGVQQEVIDSVESRGRELESQAWSLSASNAKLVGLMGRLLELTPDSLQKTMIQAEFGQVIKTN